MIASCLAYGLDKPVGSVRQGKMRHDDDDDDDDDVDEQPNMRCRY